MDKMPEIAYKLIINKISLPLQLFWAANEIFPKCTALFVVTMSFLSISSTEFANTISKIKNQPDVIIFN